MDSLSSAPGNRNSKNRLLSAVFAIAASVSGSVNAATTPTPVFTEEPAGSSKLVSAASAQQAILDMLPADHKSRPGITAAIKALEDGGSTQELTNLFIWAKTIVDSPIAPPAAKEKAEEILDILQRNDAQLDVGNGNNVANNPPVQVVENKLPPIGQPKPKPIPLDLTGLEKWNNWWNINWMSKKGKINIEKPKKSSKDASDAKIIIEPVEITQSYISITRWIERQTKKGWSEVIISCSFAIENLPGSTLYLQYAQVDPSTKQWTGYQSVDFTQNWQASIKISGSGPIRFGLGVKWLPRNADGSPKEVPNAKISITGLQIEEIKDTK